MKNWTQRLFGFLVIALAGRLLAAEPVFRDLQIKVPESEAVNEAMKRMDFVQMEKAMRAVVEAQSRPSPEQVFTDPKLQALAGAASKGDEAEVGKLIGDGVDVNSTGGGRHTPLSYEVLIGNRRGAELLLQKGANVNAPILVGTMLDTLMEAAARYENTSWLELFLKYGGDVNAVRAETGVTPLFAAVNSRRLENIRLLIEKGAKLEARDTGERTPFYFAVLNRRFDSAEVLLKAGADWRFVGNPLLGRPTVDTFLQQSIKTLEHFGPLWEARLKLIDLLVEKGAQLSPDVLASREVVPISKATIGGRVKLEYYQLQWTSRPEKVPGGESLVLVNAAMGAFGVRVGVGAGGGNTAEARRGLVERLVGTPVKAEEIKPVEFLGRPGFEYVGVTKVQDTQLYSRAVLVVDGGDALAIYSLGKGMDPMAYPEIKAIWGTVEIVK